MRKKGNPAIRLISGDTLVRFFIFIIKKGIARKIAKDMTITSVIQGIFHLINLFEKRYSNTLYNKNPMVVEMEAPIKPHLGIKDRFTVKLTIAATTTT